MESRTYREATNLVANHSKNITSQGARGGLSTSVTPCVDKAKMPHPCQVDVEGKKCRFYSLFINIRTKFSLNISICVYFSVSFTEDWGFKFIYLHVQIFFRNCDNLNITQDIQEKLSSKATLSIYEGLFALVGGKKIKNKIFCLAHIGGKNKNFSPENFICRILN